MMEVRFAMVALEPKSLPSEAIGTGGSNGITPGPLPQLAKNNSIYDAALTRAGPGFRRYRDDQTGSAKLAAQAPSSWN